MQLDNIARPTGSHISAAQALASYRAFQDVRGAIRSIIKDNSNVNNVYKFDTTSIFLAGSSAGSIAMLNAVFFPD